MNTSERATAWMIERMDQMTDDELLTYAKNRKQGANSFRNQLGAPALADSEMRAAVLAYNYTRWYRPEMSSVVLEAIR